MTQAEAATVEVLKWVVAPDRPTPALQDLDQDDLLEMAAYHRILGQLLARLEAARPSWCPASLLTRLRIRQHQIRRQAREKMAAAREITRAMRARGLHPPIFVKGFAAHALTADQDSLHFSGDLDPFAEDLPAFWDAMRGLGYGGHRKDTHEWAKMYRGGITLDVHQYYPVLSYPDDVRTAPAGELAASQNPGHWRLPARALALAPGGERIRWDDLAAGATPGVAEGTEELLFPAPTLMCLIHCTHCFRSSVTRLHYLNPLGGFRLYELMSIHGLARLPAFDAGRFRALVDRFSAHDAVRHVNSLAHAFLGAAAVPEPEAAHPRPPGFPEHLIYGGWVSLQSPDDFLRLRGIEQILDQLEASTAPARCSLDSADVPRRLTYGDDPPPLRLNIAWDAPGEAVTLDWSRIDTAVPCAAHELLIHFGYDSSVRVGLDAGGVVNAVVQKSDYLRPDQQPIAQASGSRTVRLVCPVPPVPARCGPHAAASLSLFLAVRRLAPGGETTEAATYLPVRLIA